ncbi:hypothetical protein EJ110_NYTH14253 [Nymphaea thermarum]|nr:hypothetical protein EJ110_NYTH14253 [Nymphaea thermarum]
MVLPLHSSPTETDDGMQTASTYGKQPTASSDGGRRKTSQSSSWTSDAPLSVQRTLVGTKKALAIRRTDCIQ